MEVRVDEDFGTVRVERMVGAFDSGRIYNPKLAESQWIGGMIMGLGQALLEEGVVDPRDGPVINASLADYVVPVIWTFLTSLRFPLTSLISKQLLLAARQSASLVSWAWRQPSRMPCSMPRASNAAGMILATIDGLKSSDTGGFFA